MEYQQLDVTISSENTAAEIKSKLVQKLRPTWQLEDTVVQVRCQRASRAFRGRIILSATLRVPQLKTSLHHVNLWIWLDVQMCSRYFHVG